MHARLVSVSEVKNEVVVEFFGMPRQRAGCAELTVPASSLSEALAQVERLCPGLRGLRRPDGTLAPYYLVSIDGREFVRDMEKPLSPGTHILLLSADAGG